MTMVCPVCKRGNGAWIGCHNAACTDGRNLIPVSPAVADLAAARAEIERLTRDLASDRLLIIEQAKRIKKAEAERDEARADVVAMAEMAAAVIEDMSQNPGTTWGQVKAAVRALGDLGDRQALEAYGREKVREGYRRAVDLYPQGIAAILAAMEKEGGE